MTIQIGTILLRKRATGSDWLTVRVRVIEERKLFGNRVDYLVTPIEGSGSCWVSDTSLTIDGTSE